MNYVRSPKYLGVWIQLRFFLVLILSRFELYKINITYIFHFISPNVNKIPRVYKNYVCFTLVLVSSMSREVVKSRIGWSKPFLTIRSSFYVLEFRSPILGFSYVYLIFYDLRVTCLASKRFGCNLEYLVPFMEA